MGNVFVLLSTSSWAKRYNQSFFWGFFSTTFTDFLRVRFACHFLLKKMVLSSLQTLLQLYLKPTGALCQHFSNYAFNALKFRKMLSFWALSWPSDASKLSHKVANTHVYHEIIKVSTDHLHTWSFVRYGHAISFSLSQTPLGLFFGTHFVFQ